MISVKFKFFFLDQLQTSSRLLVHSTEVLLWWYLILVVSNRYRTVGQWSLIHIISRIAIAFTTTTEQYSGLALLFWIRQPLTINSLVIVVVSNQADALRYICWLICENYEMTFIAHENALLLKLIKVTEARESLL